MLHNVTRVSASILASLSRRATTAGVTTIPRVCKTKLRYVLVTDHRCGMLHGAPLRSKVSPVNWLTKFLTIYAPPGPDKYVRLNQGGELARCKEILHLLNIAGYNVEPTGAGKHGANGPGERPHQTIGIPLRAMLTGAKPATQVLARRFSTLYPIVQHDPART